jgi:hypothetical protein
VPLGGPIPEADGVIFPQLLGEAYRQAAEAFPRHPRCRSCWSRPSSARCRCGTGRSPSICVHGVATIAPYNLSKRRNRLRGAWPSKRELKTTKFLVYQDDPGEGFQAPIFKRFYWWEDECSQRLHDKFGVTIVKKSFRELGAAAQAIPDALADAAFDVAALERADEGLTPRAVRSAVKLYLAVKRDLDADRPSAPRASTA